MDTLQKMSASPRRRGLTDSHSRLQLWLPLADPSQKAWATDSDHETSAQVSGGRKRQKVGGGLHGGIQHLNMGCRELGKTQQHHPGRGFPRQAVEVVMGP